MIRVGIVCLYLLALGPNYLTLHPRDVFGIGHRRALDSLGRVSGHRGPNQRVGNHRQSQTICWSA